MFALRQSGKLTSVSNAKGLSTHFVEMPKAKKDMGKKYYALSVKMVSSRFNKFMFFIKKTHKEPNNFACSAGR